MDSVCLLLLIEAIISGVMRLLIRVISLNYMDLCMLLQSLVTFLFKSEIKILQCFEQVQPFKCFK